MERIKEMLLPDNLDKKESLRVADILYQTGDRQPLCDFIEQRYFNVFDNRDYAWANELTEATTQVQDYQEALETAYQGELRWRVYTVIALGFERLVWL